MRRNVPPSVNMAWTAAGFLLYAASKALWLKVMVPDEVMAKLVDSPAVPSDPEPETPTACPTMDSTCCASSVSDVCPLRGAAVFVDWLYAVSVEMLESTWLAALTRDATWLTTWEPSGATVIVTGVALTCARLNVLTPGSSPVTVLVWEVTSKPPVPPIEMTASWATVVVCSAPSEEAEKACVSTVAAPAVPVLFDVTSNAATRWCQPAARSPHAGVRSR